MSRFSSKAIQKNLKTIQQNIELGAFEKAQKLLKPLLKNGKGGKFALLYQIQVLRGTNRFDEALFRLQGAKIRYPSDKYFRLEEGKMLLKLGRPREAIESFQHCATLIRSEGDLFDVAFAHFQCQRFSICLEIVFPYLMQTQNGKLPALAADAYFQLGKFEEAALHYNHALALGYQSYSLSLQLGHTYSHLGKLNEAEKIFRCLLEANTHDIEATLGLGGCMQARGQYHKALALYRSVQAWQMEEKRLLKVAGICALYVGLYADAESYFSLLLKQGETASALLTYYGFSLEGQKKWLKAEEIYLKLIHSFPNSIHGYRALAWMFGVGLSTMISAEQGIRFAHLSLDLQNDCTAWEILSACEARIGNFARAYQIQETLSHQDHETQERVRRQQALRLLRKNVPLDDNQVLRKLVA